MNNENEKDTNIEEQQNIKEAENENVQMNNENEKNTNVEEQQDIKEIGNENVNKKKLGLILATISILLLFIRDLPYGGLIGLILSIISVILAPKETLTKAACIVYAINIIIAIISTFIFAQALFACTPDKFGV